jgi:hypothetical protein
MAAFVEAATRDRTPRFTEGQGFQDVYASDQELLGEATPTNKTHTVKRWGNWIYQKRENGKWDRLVPSPVGKKAK